LFTESGAGETQPGVEGMAGQAERPSSRQNGQQDYLLDSNETTHELDDEN